ncbi:polyketide synthetase PksP [Penicillium canariense]|uniref:Polyketide synthetase PksP n=1 Tax=Penicillium canariense TaxID=189055 RepID=A0A9W9HPU3_9EURO|nr:polyketide synthetase PksP [Penicillium canariense]KAJ5153182.1 polyketide synthetase PksP [Penicillium canariense]
MAAEFQVIVFGDQAVPYHAELQGLVTKKENKALEGFFAEAYHVLRTEISQLSPSERLRYPVSTNLRELLDAHQSSKIQNCSLDSALVCVRQIATFISYYSEKQTAYPSQASSCLVGSCTGLLAAVAVSCSQDLIDLVSFGPAVVRVAFRLGLVVQNKTRSVSLQNYSGDSPCYSAVIAGTDTDSALRLTQKYCEDEALPPLAQIYVGAVGQGSVTVSGPPARLQDFLRRNPSLKSGKVSVNGLFHSNNLYTASDADNILESLDSSSHQRISRLDILSNSNGQTIPSVRCGGLLKEAIWDILSRQLRWDLMVENVSITIARSEATEATILPFASSSGQSLASAIRQRGAKPVKLLDTSLRSLDSNSSEGKREEAAKKSKIAIIGYSGRFPEADDNEAFWELLAAGLDVHKEIPKDRFDPWLYYDPTGKKKNSSAVTKGCFVRHPDLFDARFFGMSAREAEQTDPAQRLALMTAYEAMEMAGFVPDATPSTRRDRVGVFYGTASDDYREVNSGQNVDTYFVPGGSRAFLPARINYQFRFSGPSFDVDTACSSGLAAIHIACNSLWASDCDVAIAGGTNILTNPDNWAGLDRAHFLSHTGNCNTFDDGADGYCRAESVATVLLKRLEDAELDGDPIFGTILGAYTNHSAEAVSMTRPHSGAQRAIFSRILSSAGVGGSEVSYIEMHGTGTQHGDACEMDSVLNVFAPEGTKRDQSLYLGSAKANIGHAESASGVSSLIKVLLMMEKGSIPPHVGIKTKINRNFPTDLTQRNVHIAMQTAAWPRPDPKQKPRGRRAFVNNFGAAGGNSSVLLEDAPLPIEARGVHDNRPVHVVTVSAKSQTSLKSNIRALLEYLDASPEVSISALSHTTTARRVHYSFRAAVIGSSIPDIRRALQVAHVKDQYRSTASGSKAPVGLCFTGQGAQYLGMGRKLLAFPQFRSLLAGLDEMVQLQGFQSILAVIDGSSSVSMESLATPTLQLAIVSLQMALSKFWKALGITPDLIIGHSLGEYAAMNSAGVLSDADTIYLVGTRAALLEKFCSAGTHVMLAIKAAASHVMTLLAQYPNIEVTCVNGPGETVVGGPEDEIQKFEKALSNISIRGDRVKVQFAFHSSQVDPMLEAFQQSCRTVAFNDPSVPMLSPLLGKTINSAAEFGSPEVYLSRHCRETVNFYGALQSARQSSAIPDNMIWVEIGPHPVCGGMLKSTLGTSIKHFASLRRGEDDWKIFLQTVAGLYDHGLPINWAEYHSGFKDSLRVLRLPAYQWELKSYWIPYAHDWCLTKGDAPALTSQPALPASLEKVQKQQLTVSVQDVVDEKYEYDNAWITAKSDVQHPDFRAVLLGHRVNGQPVSSSAVYADMASTLFKRLLEKSPVSFDKSDIGIEITNMVANKSLILNDNPTQMLEMKAQVNWFTLLGTFSLSSISADGKPTAHHAECTATFSEKSRWASEWKRRDFLVKSRINDLRQAVHDDSDAVHLVKTGMFYKLFSSLVEYNPSFKGCRELILRSSELESTGKVKFNTPPGTAEKWTYPPYWLDSLGQITGFTMNANDSVDSKTQAFINHGWENMRILETLSPDVMYQTYLKMQEKDEKSYIGDVYILNSETSSIVAMYEGVIFTAIQRKVLDLVLPPSDASRISKPLASQSHSTPRTASIPPRPAPAPARSQPAFISHENLSTEPPLLLEPECDDGLTADKLRAIIAEEVGAPLDEVKNDVEITDLGVDSLLALTMSDRILEELDFKIDSTAFLAGITVKDLIEMVAGSSTTSSDTAPSTPPREPVPDLVPLPKGVETPLSSLSSLANQISDDFDFHQQKSQPPACTPLSLVIVLHATVPIPQVIRRTGQIPRATSVLLQGNPSTSTKILWLFPDGSGVATSYVILPDIDPREVTVYGLNSPFIKHPEEMSDYRFEELSAAFLTEIRRRQPNGPYHLGGWSAGGICAYHAAQQLITDGQDVEGLILIDSPNPIGPKKLPERLYDEFQKLNLFSSSTGRNPPAWLLPHFMGFSHILDTHSSLPWQSTKPLPTWILWAKEGVDQDNSIVIQPGDPINMRWLLQTRTESDLGPNGWDRLVGRSNITIEVIGDANHFSMMKEPAVGRVADFMRAALSNASRSL